MFIDKEKILKFCTAQNIFAAVYIVLIFTILLIPSLGVKTKKDLHLENRVAAPFPEVSCKNYKNFASQFEKWLSDRFQKRKQYIYAWNYILATFFHESPNEQVVMGKDGFIFLASHWAGKEKKNSLFKFLLSPDPEVIRTNVQGLLAYKEYLQKAGPRILFVYVPTKHVLYCDKIPEKIRNEFSANQEWISVCTKITESLKEADPVYAEKYFLDLYPDALEAKGKITLIPPKNFHWIPGPYTHLAAHRIAEKFNVTQGKFVLDPENYVLKDTESDLEFFFGFTLDNPSRCLSEKSNPAKRILFVNKFPLKNCPDPIASTIFYSENPKAGGGRILAIGDSFTPAICQDLSRYFSSVTVMDLSAMLRYSPQQGKFVFKEVVRMFHPDYLAIISHAGYIHTDIVIEAINDRTLLPPE